MNRLSVLTDREFDVLIVGAGIYGATLAEAAARAGLDVALIDRGDFGEGASANSLKILHGGLRYLQQLDLARMRESIAARREGFLRLPHLTHPVACLAPVQRGLKRSALAFRAAACLNDAVSFDRNRGVPASHHIPRAKVWPARELRSRCPALAGVAGALCWSDGFVQNTERFTLEHVRRAQEAGAAALNYAPVVRLIREGHRIRGVGVRDADGTDEYLARARITVHAAGAWVPELWPLPEAEGMTGTWVRAYNLVTKRNWFGAHGVGLEGRVADDGPRGTVRRLYFFMPWRGGTMIGTEYRTFDPVREPCALMPEEIGDFVRKVNQIAPFAGLAPEDVTFAHVGVQPAQTDRQGRPVVEPSRTTRILDFRASHGIDGYMAIQGVKYTTAPIWAGRLTDMLCRRLDRKASDTPFEAGEPVSAEIIRCDAAETGWTMEAATAGWVAGQYGPRYREIIETARDDDRLRALVPGTDAPLAAVAHAVRREAARHLVDVIFRRTDLGTFAYPAADTLEAASAVMARECGWDETRRAEELARVRDAYRRVGLAEVR